jgi:glycosyltransferase involved in cell wall biosynthesis
MIARELEEFFASFGSDAARVDDHDEPADPATGFFSNVNSAILRACWEEVRFRDVGYSEDQAFARDAYARDWKKAYVPEAGVLHAHDYPFSQFMRRYFDEYRGLRHSVGHVEPLGARSIARRAFTEARADAAYLKRKGAGRGEVLAWTVRSARHHAGRDLFAGLGSRADRLPSAIQSRLSLERAGAANSGGFTRIDAVASHQFESVADRSRRPAAPLGQSSPHDGDKALMHLAWLIPPFRRGSGGHMTIFTLVSELEKRGHSNSIWLHDPGATMHPSAAVAQREIAEHFAPIRAGVFKDFRDWHGADVAFATGWQTAYPLAPLENCSLKAYLVQDYEPDFYPASSERVWAETTYSMGYPCVAASPWLRDLLRLRYAATAEAFELGVDFNVYKPLGLEREPETIVYYARPATPRRATELGLLGLAELKRRRPSVRIVLFGDTAAPRAPFDYEFGGIMEPAALAELYNRATVGLVLSLSNYSRMPKEMMACDLPVVDLDHPSVVSVFGSGGDVISLCRPDPISIADRLAGLLDDHEKRTTIAASAREFVSGMTWSAAAVQIEEALRIWLRERWSRTLAAGADEAMDESSETVAAARARLV